MIEAIEVTKSFGDVAALDGVNVSVPEGSIHGLLGHNGAGKTTLVNIFSTLLEPTAGTARIRGLDVTAEPQKVRRCIGLTGQFASVDEQLSGRDNLVLIARLLGASKRQARTRVDELLELFDLSDAAGRAVSQYSGGMRRRLDIAASLVGSPKVIFLDEPTTGLDPTSRLGVWEIVKRLAKDGVSVLLTTQYLEEADRLCDRITLLSKGRVIAEGTPGELKADVGQRMVTVTLPAQTEVPGAVKALEDSGIRAIPQESGTTISVPVTASADLAAIVRTLNEARTEITELGFSEPTLDDVYLRLTREPTGKSVPA
ncbi:ATP-binding cassette domain-containing protein [Streptomyces alkaliphilus]|uniref:ATP-binding cassette domain-containing protein n=1 Tax=Streptomyces alkaliphilus TaxID=1472722 RepID=UPI00117E9F71|nr:ATP-binding cassette domain-containing protein [Streptomyces alkaliphilus]MQS09277.1 ATP-binding cassette domain-containing protein [Streptomyces alkaliphilus]